METHLDEKTRASPAAASIEGILRSCVHCGFCLATCPTYQILGDERDSPRGRIYLIKALMEGKAEGKETRLHLDRCLTCRSCETTCPSGVEYAHLLEEGRQWVEKTVPRPLGQRVVRTLLKTVLPRPVLFQTLLNMGRMVRPLLPERWGSAIPARQGAGWIPSVRHDRRVVFLAGCVQPALTPATQGAAQRLLDRLGISGVVAPGAGCCGALAHHLGDEEKALEAMRRNIDAWWPLVEQGAEAIVSTASGCGAEVREYGHALRHDPAYRERASRVTELAQDISEVLIREIGVTLDEQRLTLKSLGIDSDRSKGRVAFHAPCSLQHGLRLRGGVEQLLRAAGAELTAVEDAHLCCGSAGTYSILQPELSGQLKKNKLAALKAGKPEVILSANIGCQMHLAKDETIPVRHWVEWLDDLIPRRAGGA